MYTCTFCDILWPEVQSHSDDGHMQVTAPSSAPVLGQAHPTNVMHSSSHSTVVSSVLCHTVPFQCNYFILCATNHSNIVSTILCHTEVGGDIHIL